MNVLKHKWVFKKKPIDEHHTEFLCKARCVTCGDLQEAYLDFNPDSPYAPVASNEILRLIIAFAAKNNLILDGGDVANTYLYGKIDVPIFLEQPTDSSGNEQYPGKVCQLYESFYGVRQAANIWGSTFHTKIISWGFRVSNFDVGIYFLKAGNSFIILAIVVDDMCFASNDSDLLEEFKRKLRNTFDIRLFGPLKHFIEWSVARDCNDLFVHQKPYMLKLLEKYGMKKANKV